MRRVLLAAAVVVASCAVVPLLITGPAVAECTVPELPQVGCLVPSPSPTPTDSESPPAEPTEEPTYVEPTSEPLPEPTVDVGAAPIGLPPVVPEQPPAIPPPPQPVLPPAAPAAAPVAVTTPLTQVVPSAYAIVVFGLLGVALLAGFLSGLRPAGGTVNATRTRLWAGLGTLAVAAIIGGLGWYRISGEPLLNRQIPFLASAGIAVVVLAVLGGALIVAEQLRADQDRIGELEDAVRALTEALAPTIENPPRR
jgi:hypothetical protein